MRALVERHDWGATPLGPRASWPQSLGTLVETVLDAPTAMIVLWGPDLVQIYNDAYRVVMAAKHPGGLGQPTRECWPEVWDFNAPIYEAVLRGEARAFADQRLTIERHGAPEEAWFDLAFSPVRREGGEIAGVLVTVVETTGKALAEASLRESERRQRALVESLPQLVWRAGAGGQRLWSSPQWCRVTGLDAEASAGLGWLDAVHPEDREAVRHAFATAGPDAPVALGHRLRHAPSGAWRWVETRAEPVDGGGSTPERVCAATDVHELRALLEQREVLVRELQHRGRNLLTVVSAIARRSAARSETVAEMSERLGERLAALARAQGLVLATESETVTLAAVVRTELEARGADLADPRTRLEGPDLALDASVVQNLALALHELATNALKHGALAVPDGRLHVRWRVEPRRDEAPMLHFDWEETWPTATHTAAGMGVRRGYGRELIERALPALLGGTTRFSLRPRALSCAIAFPLRNDASIREPATLAASRTA